MKFVAKVWFCLLLLIASQTGLAAETNEKKAERLFHEGYILYQRHLDPDALVKFRKAANLGHVEAAYYAGEVIRIGHTLITPEAEKWYRKASKGGDVYAMLRLANADLCNLMTDCAISKDEWLEKALNEALPKAKAGDVDAMDALELVYGIMGDDDESMDWLRKAASEGKPFSQYWLSHRIQAGSGFYWTDVARTEDAIHWMQKSAEAGYPKAIHDLAELLQKHGHLEKARHWAREMGKTDYFTALFDYGVALIRGPKSIYKFSKSNFKEGLAVLFALHRQTGSSDADFTIKYFSEQKAIPSSVINAAKARSKKLLVDTPILHYDPKFGL